MEPLEAPDINLETKLRGEIEKWTFRIREDIKKARLAGGTKEKEKNAHLLTNIRAYIEDSGYFLEKGDFIRSFEAIIWAWSWLEILKELKVLE